MGAIVVLYKQEKPLELYPNRDEGQLLLAALVDEANANAPIPDQLAPQERAIWGRLIADFQSNDEFNTRAKAEMRKFEEAALEGNQVSSANRLVSQVSYPLTIFAMIVVVLAFGHLLSHKPSLDSESNDGKRQELVVKSFVFIALFSLLDLVWTLAATNAGTMRELNPLGSQFIRDPIILATFKLFVTTLSIGIFYSLRRRPTAQVASWWCCLLLTLLTARWVVFQSMFA